MQNCPPKKEDQRVRLTKKLLQDAFLALLQQKPVQAITVKELCQRAEVNRGTFYLHYKDIYDLMEQMENELLATLEDLLAQNQVIATGTRKEASAAFLAALFQFFERNREMCAILLGDNGDKNFVARIVETARQKSVKEYMELYPHISRTQAELFYYFIATGFLGLLRYSLQNGRSLSSKALATSAERIIEAASAYLEQPL